MPSPAVIAWALLFGAIGMGYFVYGKQQRKVMPLVCGIALMVFPYFVSGAWMMLGVGVVLAAIPFFARF